MNAGRARAAWGLALAFAVGAASAARAADCHLSIEANDMIQFNARTMQVDAACTQIELTLQHVGKQSAHVLGHDWVLARSSDVSALANAGVAAGFDKGYLPVDDRRVIAATRIVGGGETTTITFSADKLVAGADYTFFCSYPGHSSMMRGRFRVTGKENLASNRSEPASQAAPSR